MKLARVIFVVFFLVTGIICAVAAETQPPSVEGSWLGALKVQDIQLRIVFNITRESNGTLSATLDSPDQGAKGIPMDTVTFTGGELKITAASLAGGYVGKFSADGKTITGTWTQAGRSFPLDLARSQRPVVAAVRRPQEPKPPYPYLEEEVSYPNKEAGIKLAGTLTMPKAGGPFPAVILITGSGPENRDEALMGHKPFKVLADYLTRRGIAVLRSDDRGVGKSTGDFAKATTEDFASDALAGVAYLKTRKEIDPKHIGLIGHSEGGIIAPMAVVRSRDVAFLVLIAGTGFPGDHIIVRQTIDIARAQKANPKTTKLIADQLRKMLAVAKQPTSQAVAEK
jgi:uncharacterized protein